MTSAFLWRAFRPLRLPALGLAAAAAVAMTGFFTAPSPARATVAGSTTPGVQGIAAVPELTKLHTSGSQILDAANNPFRIKAANWFGMETSDCAPHGLWQISLDSGMAQIAGFGFNAIRLPFSNQCLEQTTPVHGIDTDKNPGLRNKTPLQILDAVVASAKTHGLRIILDRHRPDSAAQSELWYTAGYSESTWIADWVMLAKRYAGEPAVVGADLHNEPHGSACWGCGDASRDWAAAATRAGNAVLAADPHLLILVEGVGQLADGSYTWWGGGLADAAAHPIVLNVPHQLVYSPHDYPASVYPQPWLGAKDFPANLPGRWDAQFGFLQQQNIAPVLLGEFGTKLETTGDRQWLAAMVSYLNSNELSFAYWSFNPDSGDTGGLVQDDWVTPQTAKLTALQPLLGGSAGTDATPPTNPSGLTAAWNLQAAWYSGYVANVAVSARTAVRGWSISWPDPNASSVVDAWGMACSVHAGVIRCTGADWAAPIPAGGTVNVGLRVAGNGSAPRNPVVTVG